MSIINKKESLLMQVKNKDKQLPPKPPWPNDYIRIRKQIKTFINSDWNDLDIFVNEFLDKINPNDVLDIRTTNIDNLHKVIIIYLKKDKK